MSAPSLTISVLAFHSIATVERCLESCRTVGHDGPVTIAVREQGGDPEESALIERWRQSAAARTDRNLVVTRGPNLGYAGGHNLALRDWPTDFFLALNADAELDPGFVHQCMAAFADPTVGAVQGKVLRNGADVPTIDTTGLLPLRNRAVVNRGQGEQDSGQFDTSGEVFGPDGAAPLYRRAALDDVAIPITQRAAVGEVLEYFDEDFVAYKEDVDLAWRLQWRAWRTAYVPTAIAWHSRRARGGQANGLRGFIGERLDQPVALRRRGFANHRLTQLKNDDVRALTRDLGPFVARELAAWTFGLLTDPGLVTALGTLARRFPAARRKRRWIFAHRIDGANPYRWFTPIKG